MGVRTYTIELRVDDSNPEHTEVMEVACRTAAKHVYTQAILLGAERPPEIAMQWGDMFERDREIMLADDIE